MPQFIFTAAIPSLDIPDTQFYIEANNPFKVTTSLTLLEEEKGKELLSRIDQYIMNSEFDLKIASIDWRISVPSLAFSSIKESREPVAAKDLHEYLWYMQELEGFLRYGGVTNQEWVRMIDPFYLKKGILQ